ncbi:MAG: hypothetical protein BJ554DRAFT_2299, partial [Olpidium bornovanus]
CTRWARGFAPACDRGLLLSSAVHEIRRPAGNFGQAKKLVRFLPHPPLFHTVSPGCFSGIAAFSPPYALSFFLGVQSELDRAGHDEKGRPASHRRTWGLVYARPMSVADELLADLEALDDADLEDADQQGLEAAGNGAGGSTDSDLADLEELPDAEEDDAGGGGTHAGRDEEQADSHDKDVTSVARLLHSAKMRHVRERIEYYRELRCRGEEATAGSQEKQQQQHVPGAGPAEADPEYKLVVQANDLAVGIDDEIVVVHKVGCPTAGVLAARELSYIRDHYAPRFPELESLVLNPLDYARAVQAVGNQIDLTKIDLAPILPPATVMVVTVTGSTTSGKPLPDDELRRVSEACDMALQLDIVKRTILEYVESRMAFTAPNLSAIVGAYTAARLMGAAGGLTALSKMPACNIQVLGKANKAGTGFSSVTQNKHAGFIASSELVARRPPPDFRQKMNRLVAAKCALAARVDRSHDSPGAEIGRKLREEIEQKLEKWQEPPPSKGIKALPVPDEAPKKRRGGRRSRAMKESYAVTELRKQQNRVAFGVEEAETGGTTGSTKGLGLLGQHIGGGKIRAAVVDTRTRAKPGLKTPKA